jgi:hypothetical protein
LSFNSVQNFNLTANALAISISGLGDMHLNGDLYLGGTLTNLSMRGLARIWNPEGSCVAATIEVPPKTPSFDKPTSLAAIDKGEKVST